LIGNGGVANGPLLGVSLGGGSDEFGLGRSITLNGCDILLSNRLSKIDA